jgi:hypothetical protein
VIAARRSSPAARHASADTKLTIKKYIVCGLDLIGDAFSDRRQVLLRREMV